MNPPEVQEEGVLWQKTEGWLRHVAAMAYDLLDARAPVLSGRTLRLSARMSETPVVGRLVVAEMLRNVGIKRMRKSNPLEVAEPMTHWRPEYEAAWEQGEGALGDLPLGPIAQAYRSGDATPAEVVGDALARLRSDAEDAGGVHPLVFTFEDEAIAAAAASDARFLAGRPIGPLDGVPMVIKDVIDTAGVPTCSGTGFVGDLNGPALRDGTVPRRLKEAGAIILGKSISHELGMGVFGINPNHGTVRNPVDQGCMSGGSSSGSAAAVGAGFVPLAYGTDGGGSVRIPCSLCGVLGLKTTHGRMSGDGSSGLCPSVAQAGPIASSVADLAAGLAMMSGPDPLDPKTLEQPRLDFNSLSDHDLSGLRIGVYREWFEDADAEVIAGCDKALETLVSAGARLVPVEVEDLDLARLAHLTTITREMLASQGDWLAANRRRYGGDIRLYLSMAKGLTVKDDYKARLIRHRVVSRFIDLFEEIDLLATPSTACTAPPIPKGAETAGLSDLATISALMRFMHIPNLTGQPAISIPLNDDSRGLPIGLHLVARPWEEMLLLRCAGVLED